MKNKVSSVALVFNDKNELALQLRAASDNSYPLHWDFSAAGGIEPDEDQKTAATRELKEELGITAEIEFVGEELYEDEKCTDKLYIYKTRHNGPFKPDPKEVEDIRFFKLDDIQKMLDSGEKFHPEFPFVWNREVISQALE